MSDIIRRRAIGEALENGRALLKFISANDAGATDGHQSGFYLPTACHEMFTPQSPERGVNHKHPVRIIWQDGRVTDSMVTWYGRAKQEYRLTRFGRDFPFLRDDSVGSLLLLIPRDRNNFLAYVFDSEDDIEEVQAALGVEIAGRWGAYRGPLFDLGVEDECIDGKFRGFVSGVDVFPDGQAMSGFTWCVLAECIGGFTEARSDNQLIRAVREEYQLFRLVERKLCEADIRREFSNIDNFLKVASSIMNRRKSRAGRSFENHVGRIFKEAGIPCDVRPSEIDGKPDIVVPGADEYNDASWPDEKLFVIGLKTTCKDRWRQVLHEGRRVMEKHLITLQEGISTNQLREMADARVNLIVPEELQQSYPPGSPIDILSLSSFLEKIKRALNA